MGTAQLTLKARQIAHTPYGKRAEKIGKIYKKSPRKHAASNAYTEVKRELFFSQAGEVPR